jgi:hypothetical protein
MPYIDSHYSWYGRAATSEPQPYQPRIFKSHMPLSELQEVGLAPPFSDDTRTSFATTTSLAPSLSIQYPRIIFCWRPREDVLNSWYWFLPPFTHVHPTWIPFDAFIDQCYNGFVKMNEPSRLQSLVDFWRLRHHPSILVAAMLIRMLILVDAV